MARKPSSDTDKREKGFRVLHVTSCSEDIQVPCLSNVHASVTLITPHHPACLPYALPSLSPAMSEEKEQTRIDEANSDRVTDESGPDAIDEKKLLRKLDWHLVPGLTLLFLLSFLDRSNGILLSRSSCLPSAHLLSVGNARIEGLATDLNMSMFSPPSTVNDCF